MTLLFDDTRDAWGALSPKHPLDAVSPALRTEFFVHYIGGDPLHVPDHQGCLSAVRAFQTYHQTRNGWADIGYNGLVCQHGRAIEGRGLLFVGAHCPNHNTSGYGFQFMVGGQQAPSDAAKARMRRLYDDCSRYSGRALLKKGHRDGYATECPGDTIHAWVRSGMPTPTTQKDWFTMATEADLRAIVREEIERAFKADVIPSPMFANNPTMTRDSALRFGAEWALQARNKVTDPAAVAAAVAKALPATSTVTSDQLEAALRSVLGSVDDN